MLKRVRRAFDAEAAKGIVMTSTYRSGINIKFGKAYFDLLGQVTYGTADGADWSKGAIMFDFPSFQPSVGDGLRFNEPFCKSDSSLCLRLRVVDGSADDEQIKTWPISSSTSSRAARTGRRIRARCLSGASRISIRIT